MKTFATRDRQHSTPRRHVPIRASVPRISRAPLVEIRQILYGSSVQRKLTVGAPDDAYEKEADRVADQVMRMPEPQLQRACGETCPKCSTGQLNQEHPSLQTKRVQASDRQQIVAPPVVSEGLRSPGQPLDSATRAYFEPRFGHDFSTVRVHSDTRASEAAQSVTAKAFTVGHDIVFGTGQYAPAVVEGRRLLAHELTHVLQQRGAERNAGFVAPRQARHPIAVRQRAGLSVRRQVTEENFPGGARVETIRPGEFLLWNFDVGAHPLQAGHQTEIPAIARDINAALAGDANWEVDIEGEASLTGTDAVNDPVSARRAESVRAALVAAGVDAGRVKVTSVGSRKSLPSVSQENLARSRAVRVILVPKVAAPVPAPTPAPAGAGGGPAVTPVTSTPVRSSEPTREPRAEPTAPTGTRSGKQGTTPSATPCTVTPLILSLTGGTVTLRRIGGQVVITAGDGTAANLGMSFVGLARISRAGCGELSYVQNVQTFREIVYKDGSRLRKFASSWHLDTSNPYPSQAFPGSNPTSLVRITNDSPELGTGRIGSAAFTEGLINSVEVRDEFRMFLVFSPTVGPRQPLISADWAFVGQALNTTTNLGSGTLQLDTSVSRVVPSSSTSASITQTPVLAPNVTAVNFLIVRSGVTGTQTFADLFAPILNGSGGRP